MSETIVDESVTRVGLVPGTLQTDELIARHASNKWVFRRARELVAERGWGRGAWSRRGLGMRVMRGDHCRVGHHHFSVPGAFAAALNSRFPRDSAARDREFDWACATYLSVIFCSDQSHETMKRLPLESRVTIVRDVLAMGSAGVTGCVARWNDETCRDRDHALACLDHGHWMVEEGERLVRSRLQ